MLTHVSRDTARMKVGDEYEYILNLIIVHCMHALENHTVSHQDTRQLYIS